MRNTMVGIVLIVTAGLIFTVERAMAYFDWISYRSTVMQTNGSYEARPDFPGLTENLFVVAFLASGLAILALNMVSQLRETDSTAVQ
jgi:hypothetical protein